jgi:hypothetical protein
MLVIFEQLFSPPTQAQTTLLYDTNYTTLWDRTALYTTLQFASPRATCTHKMVQYTRTGRAPVSGVLIGCTNGLRKSRP